MIVYGLPRADKAKYRRILELFLGEIMAHSLVELCQAERGLVSAIGAGGKKSLLLRLAKAHAGPVGLTATVPIALPPRHGLRCLVEQDGDRLVGEISAALDQGARRLVFAGPPPKPGRLGGLEPGLVRRIYDLGRFEVTLVKADGARMLALKAPEAWEPVCPEGTTTVLAVLSASVIDQPLSDRIAHRIDRVEAVTGICRGATLTPEALARLMTSEDGLLKGCGSAAVVPVINMVDDQERLARARTLAVQALNQTRRFDKVVLTCLRAEDPVVDVVVR